MMIPTVSPFSKVKKVSQRFKIQTCIMWCLGMRQLCPLAFNEHDKDMARKVRTINSDRVGYCLSTIYSEA
jgi:hypothetical protein